MLGERHATGHKLASKLAGCDLPESVLIPGHDALERIALFHELDHLRPDSMEKCDRNAGGHLREETGRDHFALQITENAGLTTASERQAFIDYRLLGGIHGSDSAHRTGLGLTLLNDPYSNQDMDMWNSLHEMSEDIFSALRPDTLSGIFGKSTGFESIISLLQAMPLGFEDGRKGVENMLASGIDDPKKAAILVSCMEAYSRITGALNLGLAARPQRVSAL